MCINTLSKVFSRFFPKQYGNLMNRECFKMTDKSVFLNCTLLIELLLTAEAVCSDLFYKERCSENPSYI